MRFFFLLLNVIINRDCSNSNWYQLEYGQSYFPEQEK